MKKERFPNFLIIGAGKSGTTSLYNYLKQHPDVFMTDKKEPGFFALDGKPPNFSGPKDDIYVNNYLVYDVNEYLSLFNDVGNVKVCGEASVRYLASKVAPETIKKYSPDVKMLAILRNPVERAFSSYMMAVRDGRESIPFRIALDEVLSGKRKNWSSNGYVEAGMYYQHLSRYFQFFDAKQFKICLYEDLKSPETLIKSIFQFLEIDTNFRPNYSTKHNISGKPKFKRLHNLVTKLDDHAMLQYRKIHDQFYQLSPRLFRATQSIYRKSKSTYFQKSLQKIEIDTESKELLKAKYRTDILKLQTLINRDLSHWLE